MRPALHRPRWLYRLRARAGGWFWLPCCLCGRKFGGNEWHHRDQIVWVRWDADGGRTGHSVCPWCAGSPPTRVAMYGEPS